MPDVPTVSESGLPGYRFDVWYGLFAPGKLPHALAVMINAEVNRILRERETRQHFAAGGVEPAGGSVAEFRSYVAAETVKWTKVIREAGIRAD
jgi:tripartite-type tricarboxylate transporter receptor subunit TctC